MTTARPDALAVEPAVRRQLAAETFNFVWKLLEKEDRTPSEDELMVHAAHASRFLWDEVGDVVNQLRGEWQVSRVYAVLERADSALHHGRLCVALCQEASAGPFDLACAYEAMARAYAVAGEASEAHRYESLARDAADDIDDPDERELVLSDLDSLPLG